MCDFAQGPDWVCSLYSVIWYNKRRPAAGEHNFHGGVRCILHRRAIEQACNKHTHLDKNTTTHHSEGEKRCRWKYMWDFVIPEGLHTIGAISSRGCSMLNTVGRGSLWRKRNLSTLLYTHTQWCVFVHVHASECKLKTVVIVDALV